MIQYIKRLIKYKLMKKILTLPLLLIASTSVFAGDAPNEQTNGSFEGFFNVKAEGSLTAGNCQTQASVADVFGNEITANVDVNTDLVAIGFPDSAVDNNSLNTAGAVGANWTFDEDPCAGETEGLKLEMDEIFFGTSTNVSDDLTVTLANTFNLSEEKFSPEVSIEGNFGTLQVKEAKTALDGL